MNKTTMIPSVETFIEWAERETMELTTEEATMLLGYISGHGFGVSLNENNEIILVDTEEPENGIIATGYDELIERVCNWNYEFIQDSEVVGSQREQVLRDAKMFDNIFINCGRRSGLPLGYPTVKELIAVLSKLPEDYRVTCCGAENFLYLFCKDKYITIDNEYWLTA